MTCSKDRFQNKKDLKFLTGLKTRILYNRIALQFLIPFVSIYLCIFSLIAYKINYRIKLNVESDFKT